MSRFRTSLVACAVLGVFIAEPLLAQTISPAAAQEDFDLLWKSIREAHGGLSRHVAPSELDRRVGAHRARLDKAMSQGAFAGLLQESISELRDGHMRLELDSATAAARAAAAVFPLRVVLEGDRMVVAFNDSPTDTTLRPGMAILSINGRATSELVRQLLPKVPGDGFIETGKRFGLARKFPQMYWLYVEQPATFAVVARDGSGREFPASVPTRPNAGDRSPDVLLKGVSSEVSNREEKRLRASVETPPLS